MSKINNVFIDKAEDLDIVMPMYNPLDYSDSYSITSGSLLNYYRDDLNDAANENDAVNYRVNNNKTTKSKYFEHKTKVTGKTSDTESKLDTEVVVPLKYLSNFWRSLINCEIGLHLSWSKDCIISEILRTDKVTGNPNANPPAKVAKAAETKIQHLK